MLRWTRQKDRTPRRAGHFTAWPAGEIQCTRALEDARPGSRGCARAPRAAVADVERLVVDQQPHDLAVGHVDHRLAGLGVAVTGLGVGQRPRLVEAVDVGARHAVGSPSSRLPRMRDVAVGQGEQGFRLGQQVEPQLGLAQRPGLDGELGVVDHGEAS